MSLIEEVALSMALQNELIKKLQAENERFRKVAEAAEKVCALAFDYKIFGNDKLFAKIDLLENLKKALELSGFSDQLESEVSECFVHIAKKK